MIKYQAGLKALSSRFNLPSLSTRKNSSSREELMQPFHHKIEQILQHYHVYDALSDEQIRASFQAIKPTIDISECVLHNDIDIVSQAFALIRQAANRAKGMAHYDVQLAAGLAMIEQSIAELATGEGKTLVATLAASFFALYGKGVHVMTVNQYLAQRDCELMRPVYELLGLSVGFVTHDMNDEQKQQAYECDITYGVGSDFGFDYLRDQLKLHHQPKVALGQRFHGKLTGRQLKKPVIVQKRRAFAIVDEADSVMLDEASSALILSSQSGKAHPNPDVYQTANDIASKLERDKHFFIDELKNQIYLNAEHQPIWFDQLDIETRNWLQRPWETYINNALKARYLILKDEDYVVEDDEIQIVDEYTGRRFSDRTWSEGLHQAVQAKEGIIITEESQSMLKVARQQFFKLYDGLSGMTGTATGCEKEFKSIFELSVRPIPPNKKNLRKLFNTRFYKSELEKNQAIIRLVKEIHAKKMPILIGTRTVKQSELMRDLLDQVGIKAQVLNAKQDHEEAELIAEAGKYGQITIATNMAGRGTDIPLDSQSKQAGGLFVIVSEPHTSSRVDRQLIGRCARQGDPGMAAMFVSADDDICTHSQYFANAVSKISNRENELLEIKLAKLQATLDEKAYQSRLKLFRYNNWMANLLEKIN